jgi:hypothetical protein
MSVGSTGFQPMKNTAKMAVPLEHDTKSLQSPKNQPKESHYYV